jgi:hypothetical protein
MPAEKKLVQHLPPQRPPRKTKEEILAARTQFVRDKLAVTNADDVKILRISALPGLPNMTIRPNNPKFGELWDLIKQAMG